MFPLFTRVFFVGRCLSCNFDTSLRERSCLQLRVCQLVQYAIELRINIIEPELLVRKKVLLTIKINVLLLLLSQDGFVKISMLSHLLLNCCYLVG